MVRGNQNGVPQNRFSRRQLITSGALGSTAMLAGCFGGDSDSGNGADGNGNNTDGGLGGSGGGEGAHVEGQELILTTEFNPEQVYFLPDFGNFAEAFDSDLIEPTDLKPALYDTGMWSRVISSAYGPSPGELYPALFSDFELTPKKMTVTIQEEAGWSDGEPVTAFDLAAAFSIQQASLYDPDQDNPTLEAEDPEAASWFPVEEITMPDGRDGKVVEYHNWDWDEYPAWEEVNGFEYPSFSSIFGHLLGPGRRRGAVYPMHVDPWGSVLEERWDWRQEHKIASDDPQKQDPWQTWLSERVSLEDIRATREPGNVPTCGAWTLEEIRGTEEIVLQPNEHHYAADEINFDRVRFEWAADDQRTRASLNSGNLDSASINSSPEAADSYPDKYEQVNSPAYDGYVISMNHRSAYGDVRVRQAMMYALNTEEIAQNVNPMSTSPVTVPGGDLWAVDAVVSQDWINENLIDYSQDVDRATELMEEAGYTLEDGTWTNDGEALQASIATFGDSPVFEETVVSQLNEFGIDAEVRVMEEATFQERWTGSTTEEVVDDPESAAGNFDIWRAMMGSNLAGFYTSVDYYWYSTTNRRDRVRAHQFYDHETTEAGMNNGGEHAETGYGPSHYSWPCVPDCQMEWTIEIPPIGEPDGELEPFSPSAVLNGTIFAGKKYEDPFNDYPYYDPPHDEPHPENADYYWKKFMWTTNWFLPSLPLVLNEQQYFLNKQNWAWPTDHDMWEYFGMSWDTPLLAGMARIQADSENPKDGASVSEN